VSGIRFPTDAQHKLLKLTNKMSILVARELKRAAKTAKGRGKGVYLSLGSWWCFSFSCSFPLHSVKPLTSSSSGKSKKLNNF
jgi:hypothetical protein